MNNQQNLANLGNGINRRLPPPVNAHNQVIAENPGDDAMRRQPPVLRLQEFYKGNINITDSDGLLVLPPLPKGHTFMVTISLMQMLTARGLFSGLTSEDAHITKLRSVCKSCVGRPDLDMDVIGLRVFPFSLMGEATIWFTELSNNLIYTWDQLRDVFLALYYQVSKKINHKDRVNNFVALLGESVSSSFDGFTAFVRSVPNHRIDDDSLKE